LDWIAIDNPNSQSVNSLSREGCVFTIQFDDTGKYLVSSTHNHNIEVWDTCSKKLIKTLTDHNEIVTNIEFFNKSDEFFLSSSIDKTVKVWKNFECIHTFLDHEDWIRCIGISKSNKYFLSGCVSSIVKGWDMESKKVLFTLSNKHNDSNFLNTVNSLNYLNNDDRTFLCALRDGSIKIYDTRAKEMLQIAFKAHRIKLNSVKISNNDHFYLSSGRDNVIRLWDSRKLPVSV